MSSTSSPFGQNEWLVEEMYRKFRDDPSSVDPSWHEFLVDYSPERTIDEMAIAHTDWIFLSEAEYQEVVAERKKSQATQH